MKRDELIQYLDKEIERGEKVEKIYGVLFAIIFLVIIFLHIIGLF